jgi:hypothetical protein
MIKMPSYKKRWIIEQYDTENYSITEPAENRELYGLSRFELVSLLIHILNDDETNPEN